METSPPPNPSSGEPSEATSLATAAIAAPARIWKSIVARLPPLRDSGLVAAVSDLHRRHFSVRRRRRRRQRPSLPLPLRPAAAHSARIAGEMPKAFVILDDVVQHTLSNLHNIHKSLLFWQSKAEVHSEVDKCREGLTESSDKSLHTLFIVLNTTFSKLEVSLKNAGELQNELNIHEGKSYETLFGKLPEVDVESSHWTENLSTDGISLIYQNLQKLDDVLSSQLSRYKKPNNLTIYWLPYTCGALGLSVCSLWLLRHSSLMGSSDIDNWIRDAKESMAGFWDEHVEKPIISIRDELFETFKQRDKGIMERQELQLTEDSLSR
ncbi:hypothetical protein PR202_gb19905 [Eleusine coracana subsp. coracana]|uniref:Uncharacterized protein n=1 Tax=Eleusine coracana subsp. coracana TaxID=191504 RepID=A0AAV5F9E5_ELECO|nr:hypothetical protein PR202_gb19905 [Eleusine coracana subsp. coracana]